jgi:hypothetical protein
LGEDEENESIEFNDEGRVLAFISTKYNIIKDADILK